MGISDSKAVSKVQRIQLNQVFGEEPAASSREGTEELEDLDLTPRIPKSQQEEDQTPPLYREVLAPIKAQSNQSAKVPLPVITKMSSSPGRSLPPVRHERVRFPPPKPPKKRREEIFDHTAKQIAELDKHTLQAPKKLLVKPLTELVGYLCAKAKNDVQKVRAMFLWLASVDIQGLENEERREKMEMPPDGSPADHLLKIKWKVSLHARLLAAMCKIAGVPCVVITGMNKNAAYKIGAEADRKRMEAYWNAVFMEGSWFLVDPFWASTCVSGQSSSNWTIMETDEKFSRKNRNESRDSFEWIQEVNEFYFIVDPEVLIYTHFPDDPKWQLLKDAVTLEEFEEMPLFRDAFFRMGLGYTDKSYRQCLIYAKDDVCVEFSLPTERGEGFQFKYIFCREKEDDGKKVDHHSSEDLNKFVSCRKSDSILSYTLNFPVVGSYKFSIYGMDEGSKNDKDKDFTLICTYLIQCND